MQATAFDRDALANWYAEQHIKTDPGIRTVYYLPTDAPERELRFVEVNELLGELRDEALEPVDFGVDRGTDSEHTLRILDVTPNQWDRMEKSTLPLPRDWSLKNAVVFTRN